MINSWQICPERFRRRYIEEEIIPPGIAAKIGTGFHKGCEVNHRHKITHGENIEISIIQDAARDEYIRSIKEYGVFFPPEEKSTAKIQLEAGVDVVVSLAESYYYELASKIQPKLIEETLAVDIPGLDLPLCGRVDVFTEDGWLPDLKTAAQKWSQQKADNSIQATVYNRLIREVTGEYPKKLSFEIFIKNSKKNHYQSLETVRTGADFETLCIRIKTMMQMVYAGLFPPAASDSWMCQPKWCGYYWTCPYISKSRKVYSY